jgi:hypothetical protein
MTLSLSDSARPLDEEQAKEQANQARLDFRMIVRDLRVTVQASQDQRAHQWMRRESSRVQRVLSVYFRKRSEFHRRLRNGYGQDRREYR